MKYFLAIMFFAFMAFAANPSAASAQNRNEEAAKRTEKVRQKVAKIGTGSAATAHVVLLDETILSGYVSDANDKTFVMMNKKNVPTTVKYSDVKSVDHSAKMGTKQKYIWIGVLAGIGITIGLYIAAIQP